jgi:hypothetical protein
VATDAEQALQAEVAALRAENTSLKMEHGGGGSFRTISEPCEKHAAKPPGEQTFVEGSIVDPKTGLQPKLRDPNGFVHACADCQANHRIVEES